MQRPSVAVIGSGVSGLTSAYALRQTHDVALYEADDRLGGHAHTHQVMGSDGVLRAIDSGFIVHNERTYPTLLRLFRELGVATQETEMSMSISCQGCGLAYAGGRGPAGVLAQPRRLADPRYLRMLTEVPRFYRAARTLLADPGTDPTWQEWLDAQGFSAYFVRHFAIPLVSCVWSAGDADAGAYPARHLFTFLDHHGMLALSGSPAWRTVVGGSTSYVHTLASHLPDVRTGTPVSALERHADGVNVRTADDRSTTYDQVVLATHADQALGVLADADPSEKQALGAIDYSVNDTWLHRDARLLPQPKARASWNYRMSGCTDTADKVVVSYWMNRLHRLEAPEDYLVTLNATDHVDPASVVARMTYTHPVFTHEAVRAAELLRDAGGPRLAFAGAHLWWGFHEDGARSGVAAAHRLGGRW